MMKQGLAAFAVLCATGCTNTIYEAHFAQPSQLVKISEAATRAPFIKCHMPDGRVFVLERWSIEEGAGTITGRGLEYTANRERRGSPHAITLSLTDVALLETNRPYDVDVGTGSVVGLAIGTGASFAMTIVCLTNPQACFGR